MLQADDKDGIVGQESYSSATIAFFFFSLSSEARERPRGVDYANWTTALIKYGETAAEMQKESVTQSLGQSKHNWQNLPFVYSALSKGKRILTVSNPRFVTG